MAQNCSSPSLQASHSRHESTKQPTPTTSPTAWSVTSDPTSLTVPMISWPGVIGKIPPPHSSRAWWMSEWQIPAQRMSMRTSLPRRSRRSMVVGSKSAEARGTESAGTVVVMPATLTITRRGASPRQLLLKTAGPPSSPVSGPRPAQVQA